MDAHQAFLKKFENQRFYDIYPVTVILLCVATIGIFGNFNIVWATCRKSSLRSRCNIMIALAAFAEIFHQLSHFTLAYNLFFGSTFIPLKTCFLLQIVPVFWMNFGSFIVLIIGMDRLVSILFPFIYKQSNDHLYLFFMLMFPTVFGLFMSFVAYKGLNGHETEGTFCLVASGYHDSVKDIWINGTLLTNVAIIIVYSLMWISMKMKGGKYDKKILRSLTVIMCLCLFGWFTASLVFGIVLGMGFGEEILVKTMMFVGTGCINTTIALNYPVYMYFCKNYRIAFLEQLQILTCGKCFATKESVSTVSGTVPTTKRNQVSSSEFSTA